MIQPLWHLRGLGSWRSRLFRAQVLILAGVCLLGRPSYGQDIQGAARSVRIPPEATVESLFRDFLHYARMGRFSVADTYAEALLAHPDLDPVAVMNAANRDPQSLDTLLILIRNRSLGENAAKILALIEQGEHQVRKDPQRIQRNIELLGGDPQQEFFAVRRLAESGEHAIPLMIGAMTDPTRAGLRPRLIRALPLIGKAAVNPLVMVLETKDADLKQHAISALGDIGYPQAVPYLRKVIEDPDATEESREAARRAIARIAGQTGRQFAGDPADLFLALADRFYNEEDAVRADERLDTANVWYWDKSTEMLTHIVAPTKIFGPVMAMRCAQEALHLEHEHSAVLALWLAANTRREARLGFDIESGDPNESGESDPTRPDVFPRALYFTQAAGPRYAHLVLDRAVQDQDSQVALAAIAALHQTAGESSLIGTDDYKQPLVQALQFPDLAVRVKAALALGSALPKSRFAGSANVIPVLASTVNLTGRDQILVVDPDESNRNRIVGAFRADNRDVIGSADVYEGLERARVEMPALGGIVIASDVENPGLGRAVQELRAEFQFGKTPLLILAKDATSVLAEQVALADAYAELVDARAGEEDVVSALGRAAQQSNRVEIDDDEALRLAIEAAETLRAIAVDGRTVYDVGRAEPALITALSSPHEELQTRAAGVLALLPTDTSQRAIAHVALDAGQTDSLRLAALAALAESAKRHGNRIESSQIAELVRLADQEPDLTLRTAAGRALGSINLSSNKASEIVRGYHRG